MKLTLGNESDLPGLSFLIFKMKGADSVGHAPKGRTFTQQTPDGNLHWAVPQSHRRVTEPLPSPVGRQSLTTSVGIWNVLEYFVYSVLGYQLSAQLALKNICVALNGHIKSRRFWGKKIGDWWYIFIKRPTTPLTGWVI